jgi:hypothetical protein
VRKVIGIASPDEAPNVKPTFSGDVLQLEISGPNEEHLSVIDVPGIFRDPTPGLTTKDDITLVRNMVLRYMENPRSVMLAVVPANVDVATQEILQLASDLDPDGDRTLGVLTKPDLVDSGAEDRIIDLVEGRARPMKLGWHILRNPGQKDLADPFFDRQRQEMEFFNARGPWNSLEAESVGIESLRNRLKSVLSELVRNQFTKVRIQSSTTPTLTHLTFVPGETRSSEEAGRCRGEVEGVRTRENQPSSAGCISYGNLHEIPAFGRPGLGRQVRDGQAL